jgi:hypothetical protein
VRREYGEWRAVYDEVGVADVLKRVRGELLREQLLFAASNSDLPEHEEWLAPTRLGNQVAALDDYAKRRYGIATGVLWARIWGLLSDKERRDVSEHQLALESLANLTASFGVLATMIGAFGLQRKATAVLAGAPSSIGWRTPLYCFAATFLCFSSYRAALFAFGALAERVKCLVDLNRRRVIDAFGLKPPVTIKAELDLLTHLDRFFSPSGDPLIGAWKLIAQRRPAAKEAAAPTKKKARAKARTR